MGRILTALVIAPGSLAGCAQKPETAGMNVDRDNERRLTGPVQAQGRPLELSGCAVVDGGVLVVEDELIGSVLLLRDPSGPDPVFEQIKLERKKKDRAPYSARPKLFPVQDFEDIASDRQEQVFLLGSHNGKDGERRPDREFLLRALWDKGDGELKVVGENYQILEQIAPVLEDLGSGLGLTDTRVEAAINIEGLAWHDGRLFLGLRSPLSRRGQAILLSAEVDPLFESRNALAWVATEVDLAGGGIRALDWDPELARLLILSGPPGEGDDAHPTLWQLDWESSAVAELYRFPNALAGKNPEGVCRLDAGGLLVVLDGEDGGSGSEYVLLHP